MRIGPPDDDVRVQRQSKPVNERGAETRPVDELLKVTRIPSIESNHEHNIHVRAQEQRQFERRIHNEKTTLDTREPHERRTKVRRHNEVEGSKETPLKGTDVLA